MLCKALFLCASMALVSLTLTTAAAWTIEPVVPTGGPLTHVVPKAISNAGHIVGYGTTSSGQTRAFLKYPGGNIVVLGALGGTESKAFDVSDNGVVVGVAKYANGTQKPFFTSPDGGAMSAVPLLPGWTGGEAVAVRPDGTMVGGWAHKPNFIISTDQPFWYGNFLGVRDFGLLPPDFTSCKMSGMNNRGTGSGSCTGAASRGHSSLIRLWQMKKPGHLAGHGFVIGVALNHYGRVIGHSWNGSPGPTIDRRAFISALNGGALSPINVPSGLLPVRLWLRRSTIGARLSGLHCQHSKWNCLLRLALVERYGTNLRTLPEVISPDGPRSTVQMASMIRDGSWGTGQSPRVPGFC